MQMASPGGGVSASSTAMDERRRKRRLSNRESARRTRARKQKQVTDLEAEAEALRGKKSRLDAAVRTTQRGLDVVEAENAVLRARELELGARLQSLTELLHYCMAMDNSTAGSTRKQMQQQPFMESADMMYNY